MGGSQSSREPLGDPLHSPAEAREPGIESLSLFREAPVQEYRRCRDGDQHDEGAGEHADDAADANGFRIVPREFLHGPLPGLRRQHRQQALDDEHQRERRHQVVQHAGALPRAYFPALSEPK